MSNSHPNPNSQPTGPYIPAASNSLDRTVDRSNTPNETGGESVATPLIPGYEVLGELGRGGMGVVYHARQISLNREVALKTLLRTDLSHTSVARFWAEAEVLAAVSNPHVVPVYELGEHDGRPFMVMEYVPGGTLARLLTSVRMSPREAAVIVEKIARGVAAAHDLGIVHRDLKPGNILLDAVGEPKVSDFGLAKWGTANLTQTRAVMGTPAYMAPEQAAGRAKFVGPPADVWALGVVLYECVSGQRPFVGKTTDVLLAQIQTSEPIALRSRVRELPRDLDTIVAKCLTKEPAGRYPTAAELVDDLGRFLRREPIRARPASRVERLLRWGRRKPTVAAAYGLSVLAMGLALVVLVIASLWRDAVGAKTLADGARAMADTARQDADRARREETRLRGLADDALVREAAAKDEIAFLNYTHAVELAYHEYRANNLARARSLLTSDSCPVGLRQWEWHYINRFCHTDRLTIAGHTKKVVSAVFSADGTRVVTASEDGTARLWNAVTGQQIMLFQGNNIPLRSATLSPDGQRVLTVADVVRVWDVTTGKQLVILQREGSLTTAAFTADGKRLLTTTMGYIEPTTGKVLGSPGAHLWDAETGKLLADYQGHAQYVMSAVLSPDGKKVLTGAMDGTARVWDAESGRELVVLKVGDTRVGRGMVYTAAFLPDTRRLFTVTAFDAAIWDSDTQQKLVTINHPSGALTWPFGGAISKDGTRVVTCGTDKTARIWDAVTGKPLAVLEGHAAEVTAAVFSPDGRRVVTASKDGAARVWDVSTGQRLGLLRGHTEPILSLQFSPDGKRVVTAGDTTARVWDAEAGETDRFLQFEGRKLGTVIGSGLTRNGHRLLTIHSAIESDVRVWDVTTGKVVANFKAEKEPWLSASLSADGRRVLTMPLNGPPRVWDVASGKEIVFDRRGLVAGQSVLLSDDGSRLITRTSNGSVRMWELDSGKIQTLNIPGQASQWHLLAQNGRFLLWSTVLSKSFHVWDIEKGQELAQLQGHPPGLVSAQLSTDGRRLLTTATDNQARLWDSTTGALLGTFAGHTEQVNSAAFSPDGQRLVTASKDRTVRVWDTARGKLLLTLPGHTGNVSLAAFAQNGQQIVAFGADELYDAAPRIMLFDARPVLETSETPPKAAK